MSAVSRTPVNVSGFKHSANSVSGFKNTMRSMSAVSGTPCNDDMHDHNDQ